MKKLLGVLIVAAVIAIAVIVGLKLIAPKEVVMAEILPQDVSFYYSIQNLETIWKNIKTSNFWREFSNLKLLQDIQIASGLQDLKNQFKENVGVELTEENFLKLTGREFVVAIIPAEQNAPPKILLLSRGKNKQTLTDIVNPIIDKVKQGDPTKIEEIQHEGKTISHIKSASADQPDIYIALLDNILIVGIGDTIANIKTTIDISAGANKKSLAESENYKKIIGLVGEKKELAGLFYMDFTKMKKYLQGLTLPGPEGTPTQVTTGMETLNYVGGWTEIKDGLITKLYVYPNTEALTPEMKKMWEAEPQIPATLRFVPENVLLYIASSTLDLATIWNMWQTNLKAQAPEQAQPILDNITNFETEWAIDIENDILPLVGNEVAFVFSDINTEGFMPIPKLGLAVKVTDKGKADALIADLIRKNNEKAAAEAAKIAEAATPETPAVEGAETEETGAEEAEPAAPPPAIRFQINLVEEQYEGEPIKALQLPLVGTGIAPGYTYIDDYLVIGATTKTLQEMIDVKKGKIKPLGQDPIYQKLASILPEKNNQASFINMERLMDIAIGICNWVVSFQQLGIQQGPPPEDPKELELYNQQKAQAEATIATINNNVVPLLKTLKAIKLVATASENKIDHIEQTLVLRVEDI